jgi:hypothetical protein
VFRIADLPAEPLELPPTVCLNHSSRVDQWNTQLIFGWLAMETLIVLELRPVRAEYVGSVDPWVVKARLSLGRKSSVLRLPDVSSSAYFAVPVGNLSGNIDLDLLESALGSERPGPPFVVGLLVWSDHRLPQSVAGEPHEPSGEALGSSSQLEVSVGSLFYSHLVVKIEQTHQSHYCNGGTQDE